MNARGALAVLGLLLVACVQTNATLLNPSAQRHPKLAPEQVRIYRTAAQVQGKYEEVALLHSKAESDLTNESKMLESMRRKAGELGANAIILEAIDEAGAAVKVAAAALGTTTQRRGRSIAIYVFPDSVAR